MMHLEADGSIGGIADGIFHKGIGRSIAQRNFVPQMCIRDRIVTEYQVERIVLGYPKNMNNTEGERCEKTKEFAQMLERRTGLSVVLWDERLTTVAADRHMMESGIRRENRKQYVDEIAACLLYTSRCV